MKRCIYVFCVLVLAGIFTVTGSGIGAAGTSLESYCEGFVSGAIQSPIRIDVQQTSRSVNLDVSVSGQEIQTVDDRTVWRIPNEGIEGKVGYPDLPVVTRWVRVPDNGRIELSFQLSNVSHFAAAPPHAFQLSDAEGSSPQSIDSNSEFNHGIYPPEPVTIGEPVIMRGVRMVVMSFYPIRWDGDAQEYISTQNFQAEISASNERGINEVQEITRCPSKGFDRMLETLLVNPPRRDNPDQEYPPGGYLIVADVNAPDAIMEFVDWKRRAGHPVEVLRIQGQEMDIVMLREMIREIYFEIGFEYLVLMGSNFADPPLYLPLNSNDFYDVYYGLLEGGDMFPEVAVGTFNCITEESLTCAIRRAISYQSAPYNEEIDWFTRAGIGVGACSVPQDLSPSYTGKWINEVLSRNQFDDVHTSFFADNGVDDPHELIENLYNWNVNFVIVRAHAWNLEVENINPGPVYPFQFLVSSGTISPPDNGAFNWIFRQGTPDDMKGPSAGFGHLSSPRTNNANALVGGLVESLFLLDIDTYGWARNYAIANLMRVMADGEDHIEYCFSHWQFYGDPGQWCWVGVPLEIEVQRRQEIDPDATEFSVRVVAAGGDEAVSDATVCLFQEDGPKLISQTSEDGLVNFTWSLRELNDNPLQLTVTGTGLYPNLSEVDIVDSEVWVALSNVIIDDADGGNNDQIANPAEMINLGLELLNPNGEESPEIAHITVESLSPYAVVEEVDFNVGPIAPGQMHQLENPISVEILPGCPNGEVVQLRVDLDMGDQFPAIYAGVELNVVAPDLGFVDVDGDIIIEIEGDIGPGLRSEISVPIRNRGDQATVELEAQLGSLSSFAMVTSFESHYPVIGIRQEVMPDGADFAITVDPTTVPGSIAHFQLILSGGPVQDTLHFSLPVGVPAEGAPLAPDNYGYIAIDSGDDEVVWGETPVYDWIEICPWEEEDPNMVGQQINIMMGEEQDTSILLNLPFPFIYYGEEFNQITVCSNGWIAVGDQTELVNQQNWVMPGFDGAFGMLAVFWDRLFWNMENDGLFSFHDEENGRFVIEWVTGVENRGGERSDNKFEIILFDAERYPSATGDCQILFQYHTVNNVQDQWEANAHATVGISSPDGKDGLLYSYWNIEPESCNELGPEGAILWTTVNYGNNSRLYGEVTRWVDGAAVAGVNISTSNGYETVTDEDGSYLIIGSFPEPFGITSTARSYTDFLIEDLVIEPGGQLEQNIVQPHVWLEAGPDTLQYGFQIERDEEVTISATGEGNCEYSISVVYDGEITAEDFWIPEEPIEGSLEAGENASIDIVLEGPGREIEVGVYMVDLLIANNTPREQLIIPLEITVVLEDEVNPDGNIPTSYEMYDPYPNPFNSRTTLIFALPVNSEVTFSILDLNGREAIRNIAGNYSTGQHNVVIDASELSTGLYFIQMEANNFRAIRQVLLLR